MKLKKTLVIFLIVFSLVPLYIMAGILTYNHYQSVNKIIKENLKSLGETTVLSMNGFYEERKTELQIISQYAMVDNLVVQSLDNKFGIDISAQQYVHDMLMKHKASNPYILSLSLINRDFRVVSSTEDFDSTKYSELQNIPAEKLARDFFIGSVVTRETAEGDKRLVLACKSIERNGEVIGYVAEEINVAYFDKFCTDTTLSANDVLYISDGHGETITQGYAVNGELKPYVPSEEMEAAYQKKWKIINPDRHPSGQIRFKADGKTYLTYYSTIDNTDWLMNITTCLTTHAQDSKNYLILIVITVVCITTIILAGNIFVRGQFIKPIEQMEYTLKRIQETGNYSLRILVQGQGEIGYIARQINSLIEHVEQESLKEKDGQEQLEKKATSDLLTGIYNKQSINDCVEQMVKRANEMRAKVVVGFMDVDNFKHFNTQYGHQQGDEVLKYVAKCLRESISGNVGRNGGDEFMFCMLERRNTDDVAMVMERLRNKIREGVVNTETGRIMEVTCSIGVVVALGAETKTEDLIHEADMAMYEVKEKGKDNYVIRYKIEGVV